MRNRPANNQSEATSACDILKKLIQQSAKPDFRISFFALENTYTRDTYELLRTQEACKQDMVVSPLGTERNGLFTTREEYPKQLEEAQRRAEKSSILGFRNKSSK